MNTARVFRLIHEAIDVLSVDLSGLTVFTEAASGYYVVTPLICAIAGASQVFAVVADSRYGQATAVRDRTVQLAEEWGVADRIEVLYDKPFDAIQQSDIVTNLGFVRPIDSNMVEQMKPTAVVPLMKEPWEFRPQDLDLRMCWEREIPVLGTHESDGRLQIFDYLGPLCLKKLFDLGIEVFRSKIVVIGNGIFSASITDPLLDLGADVVCVDGKGAGTYESLAGSDALIVACEPCENVAIGPRGCLPTRMLYEACPEAVVIQLKGRVDREDLDRCDIRYIPKHDPGAHFMGFTLADLGPKPVIDLHTAGLRVGELLARARLSGLDRIQSERQVLQDLLARDFSEKQKETL